MGYILAGFIGFILGSLWVRYNTNTVGNLIITKDRMAYIAIERIEDLERSSFAIFKVIHDSHV